jgi:hypothetical protein
MKLNRFIFVNCFSVLCNITSRKILPEDGHNRWPKHVGDYANMYKYIQRDATVLSWLLFQELYMFRAFTMPIIRSTLLHTAVGITYECGIVK